MRIVRWLAGNVVWLADEFLDAFPVYADWADGDGRRWRRSQWGCALGLGQVWNRLLYPGETALIMPVGQQRPGRDDKGGPEHEHVVQRPGDGEGA